MARGDGLPPRAVAADGAMLAASPAGRFVHHRGEAREMAFLRDGRLAAAGTDGRIVLIDANGRVAGTIVHEGGVSPLALSPDGSTLASGGYDRAARLWRVADGRQLPPAGPWRHRLDIAWSPDGQWLATAGEDKLIRIRRARRWRARSPATSSTSGRCASARLLASGSFDRSIRLWDVASGRMVRRPPATTGRGQRRLLARRPMLASGGDDSPVRLWRVADGARCGR